MGQHHQVSTTIDSQRAATDLAGRAVEARLAACAQVLGPITSVYRWQGAVERATEWLVLFKTAADRSAALVEQVRRWHTYAVPEIIVMPVTGGDPAYLSWIDQETSTIADEDQAPGSPG